MNKKKKKKISEKNTDRDYKKKAADLVCPKSR
jgi:hypothetical protein